MDTTTTSLLEAASDFASYPGMQNDGAAKEFLDRFPLPVVFSALQDRVGEHTLESSLVSCLERIFRTKYGASLIPRYIHFVQAGLQSDSQMVKCLACKAVFFLLENADNLESAAKLIKEHGVYSLLLMCLIEGNEQVAAASSDAIRNLALSSEGMHIIFPEDSNEATHLKKIANGCSSLARVRILALIVKLFCVSSSTATAIYASDLLGLFEKEVSNENDMLTNLSALELLYELAESPHGTTFLVKTSMLQLLSSLISNDSADSVLRSRAILLSGRLLSSPDTFSVVDENRIRGSLSAIDRRLELLKDQHTDERESALEALGLIGISFQGATFLLVRPSPVARHVIEAAFSKQGRGILLAALDAVGNIAGIERSDDSRLLGGDAEECLKYLIYKTAANSSKLSPSGLFLFVLQKEPEVRLAAYRLISALVARPWCLLEVCSRQEIINLVVDPNIESEKNGMDGRYGCCTAICKALTDSNMLNDPSLAETVGKLQEAVRRGPYLPRRKIEAQPLVVTADRF